MNSKNRIIEEKEKGRRKTNKNSSMSLINFLVDNNRKIID